jgi:hypothetical protein|nr:hypothetical protein [Candidatus Krumholzibacteria bacterium]
MSKRTTHKGALLALTGLMAFLGMAGPALAGPQIMSAYGDQLPWYSAEVNAMGATGAALYRGGYSALFNPAFLVAEQSVQINAGLALEQSAEDRFQPLFDSFDNYVTDAAIASNRQHYWSTGFAAAGRVLNGEKYPVTLGVSLTDRYPFGYTFAEELRSPYIHNDPTQRDQILETRLHEVTGTLRQLSLGAGVGLGDRFSAGLAVNYAFGNRNEVTTVRDQLIGLGEDDESYRNESDYELSGVNFTLGLRGQINERIEVGVAWESQLNVDGHFGFESTTATPDTTLISGYEGHYRYPNIFRAGLTFQPRTDPRTTFSVEVEYKPFSEMVDSQNPGYDNPQNLSDVTDARVGVEHVFYNGMPLRFGFRYIDTYADWEASTSVFSAGVGMPVHGGMVSATVELSKLTSIGEHVFGYPEEYLGDGYQTDPEARIEDTRFRVGVGYQVNF